jgi:CRISPR-associated protein Csd1
MVNFPDGSSVIPADVKAGLTKVQNFWADYVCGDGETLSDRPILTCLVTGEEREVEERLPVKIKGIPNGQTAGTALVSANASPFVSYGLPNCLTSPICREAGEGFAKALNYLISSEDSRFYLNNSVVYVFWTKQPTRYKLGASYKRNQPGKIRKVFKSVLEGKRREKLQTNQFYAVGLTASGGRAVVRDWIETTLAQAIENLIIWWDAQEIVNLYGVYGNKKYFGIIDLSHSLYRDAKKEDIARISAKLIQVAIQGGSLPLEMLAHLVRRNRAEQKVTHERAALMKLVLATQENYQEAMKDMQCLTTDPKFDHKSDRTAYHCGRLLAQLERIQESALGREVNATLIDRFYGAASTTPGKVFGGLIKDAQAHLSRIRKDKRGTYEALQQKLAEILCNISPETDKLPNNLTMQQQTIFALGYYHQRARNYKDAIDAKEAKLQKTEPENSPEA